MRSTSPGLRSAWAPAAGTAAATARVDRGDPSAPSVSGGSNAWKSAAQTTVTASGSTDALSGLAGYEYRESTDGGGTWGSASAGPSDVVSAEGETLVQFRSIDAAGNASAWTPSAPTGASTVRLDRTAPTDPSVAGGSLVWQSVASVGVSASGSTDAGGSGPATYEHRTSTDGGATWSAASAGATATVSAQGETLVQLRAVDGAGQHVGVGRGHRPDRPHEPVGAQRRRRLVGLAGVGAGQRVGIRVDRQRADRASRSTSTAPA